MFQKMWNIMQKTHGLLLFHSFLSFWSLPAAPFAFTFIMCKRVSMTFFRNSPFVLYTEERKSYGFRAAWVWLSNDRSFHLGWTVLLSLDVFYKPWSFTDCTYTLLLTNIKVRLPFWSVWARDSFPRLVWNPLPRTGALEVPENNTKHNVLCLKF